MKNSASVTYPYVLTRLFMAYWKVAGKKDVQVAGELGLTRPDFSKYKSGKHRMSADMLWQYTQGCGVSCSTFLRQADNLCEALTLNGIEVEGRNGSRLSAEVEAKVVRVTWSLVLAYWHASEVKPTAGDVLRKVLEVNRIRVGRTPAEVSKLIGVSPSCWSRLVNTDTRITIDLLGKVASALDLSLLAMYRQAEGVFALWRGDSYIPEEEAPSAPRNDHEERVVHTALSLCLMDAMRADAKSD
jgi:transcriptional regulator with XRE-family HTH domain